MLELWKSLILLISRGFPAVMGVGDHAISSSRHANTNRKNRNQMIHVLLLASSAAALQWVQNCSFMGWPDLHFTPPDLVTPNATSDWGPGGPAAGKRAREVVPSWKDKQPDSLSAWETVHHALYLPTDWAPDSTPFPIIVEFTGNGPWNDSYGDVSTGLPEYANSGFGISGGRGFLWLSLPFLDASGSYVQSYWWGCSANSSQRCEYNDSATLQYMKDAVRWVASTYNGDLNAAFLTGWSRGALAVGYFGLADDEAAGLWAGLLPYSHFDGRSTDQWVPYPAHDPVNATNRLRRLGHRRLFVTEERNGTLDSAAFLDSTGLEFNATLMSTGFCNHNDQWLLRPSTTRATMRAWIAAIVDERRRT